MQLISKYKKGVRFLLCIFDIHNKYIRDFLFKDKKSITITSVFQKDLAESGVKINKIWVDQGSEFYNRSSNSWMHDSGIEMYSHKMK